MFFRTSCARLKSEERLGAVSAAPFFLLSLFGGGLNSHNIIPDLIGDPIVATKVRGRRILLSVGSKHSDRQVSLGDCYGSPIKSGMTSVVGNISVAEALVCS